MGHLKPGLRSFGPAPRLHCYTGIDKTFINGLSPGKIKS